MAAGDALISAKQYMLEGDVGNDRPNSEAVNTKQGGTINALIDSSYDAAISVQWDGYFSTAAIFSKGGIRIRSISDIIDYEMGLAFSGTSGTNGVNFNVYDSGGSFVNTLFGSGGNRISVSGSSGTNVLIGKDVINATNINVRAGAHTVQYGNLNLTTLQAGYVLFPYVEQFARSARGLSFRLKVSEQ